MSASVGLDAHFLELYFRLLGRQTFEKIIEYKPDNLGFLGLNEEVLPVPAVAVNVEGVRFSLLEFLPYSPFNVFAGGAAFLLCERSEDRKHQLAVTAQRMNIFFLEPDFDSNV